MTVTDYCVAYMCYEDVESQDRTWTVAAEVCVCYGEEVMNRVDEEKRPKALDKKCCPETGQESRYRIRHELGPSSDSIFKHAVDIL